MTTRKPRAYYTLAVREDGRWTPQFGDYDRELVEFERQDYRDHGHKARDLKIVTSIAGRRFVEAAIAKLNAEAPPPA